jgi:hypothetical protein
MKTFELTRDHIKLLRNAYVSWDNCEFGAPCIDPKRPYGNSSVYPDMVRILGLKPSYNEEGDLDSDTEAYLSDLHGELETALQIVLMTGKFTPGLYQAADFIGNDWKLHKPTKTRKRK